MIFLNSNFLIFMLLPLFILGFFIITNKKEIERYFKKSILQKLVIKKNYLGIFGKNILLFATLFLFIVALARPVKPKEDITLQTKLPTFAILLDISASMQANDLIPNRLKFAKHKIKKLIENSYANISLYAFSDRLYQISAPTSDIKTLLFLLDHLKIPKEYMRSSNLYEALKNIKEKNIILFSDATDIKDFSKFSKLNKNLTTYLTATKKGSLIKTDNGYLKDKNLELVISKANRNIKEISKVINYSYNDDDMKKLYQTGSKTFFDIKEFEELYTYPLYLGTLLLFFSMFSLKRFKFFLLFLLIFYPFKQADALFLDFMDIKKAFNAYENKEYKKAIKLFETIAYEKKSPQSYYDLANAYYKNKEYKKALNNYKKVIAKDKELRYKTFFNMANCYYMLKDYKRAYEFYQLAKSVKPTKKVEKNIFLTLKKIKPTQKNKTIFANISSNIKNDQTDEIEIRSLMIPITKGNGSETLKPW